LSTSIFSATTSTLPVRILSFTEWRTRTVPVMRSTSS
jgi:hypothetical protein